MNQRQMRAYMRVASVLSELSYCTRLKVGCVIVKGNNTIAIGYNGTPSGEDNCCEEWVEDGDIGSGWKTKPNVIHAEDNALRKLKVWEAAGSSVFVTVAPCIDCAKKLVSANVKDVFFMDTYRCDSGLLYLRQNDINVERIML